jgi:hypothetical protein
MGRRPAVVIVFAGIDRVSTPFINAQKVQMQIHAARFQDNPNDNAYYSSDREHSHIHLPPVYPPPDLHASSKLSIGGAV